MRFSDSFIKANDALCEFDHHVPAPYFRKSFTLPFLPEKAEITVTGLGFYELYINGENVTKGPLAPYISNPDDICYYDSYDVTAHLTEGENVIGILLGNGMRNAIGGFIWDFEKARCRGPVCTAFCLEARKGEESFCLEADESVKTHPSPITFDDLRMGCRYDARLEIPDWCKVGFDDHGWENAKRERAPRGVARLCEAEPIEVRREILPVKREFFESACFARSEFSMQNAPDNEDTRRENVYVFDFGVNTAGVTRLKINGKAGQTVTVRHGEWNMDGRFSIDTTCFFGRDAHTTKRYCDYGQTDVFVCKGGEEVFTPRFKYDGFRYAWVEGLTPEQVQDDTLVLLEMSSALTPRAGFECSDPILNQLYECTVRSNFSNFFYFPTDCPHREKNGWTGDASVSAEQMLLNMSAETSLKEWLRNISAAQNGAGALPGIVPTGGWGFQWGNGPSWDSVSVNLPYYVYKYTGDVETVRENAPMMMRYLHYVMGRRNERGLIAIGLGDWCDPNQAKNGGRIASPLEVTDSFMTYQYAVRAAYLFKRIGMTCEALYANAVAKELRSAIRANLIDFDTMTVAGDCQTSQAFALEVGIFEENELAAAQSRLLAIIRRDGNVNACGMVGLRYIFHALGAMNAHDLAYEMITADHPACYGYWMRRGATTLWESFVSEERRGESHNHHFYGDVSSFLIQEIVGIQPNPTVTDPESYAIAPHFIAALEHASASYDGRGGRISVAWRRTAEDVTLTLSVPKSGTLLMPRGYTVDGSDRLALTAGEHTLLCKRA